MKRRRFGLFLRNLSRKSSRGTKANQRSNDKHKLEMEKMIQTKDALIKEKEQLRKTVKQLELDAKDEGYTRMASQTKRRNSLFRRFVQIPRCHEKAKKLPLWLKR